MLRRESYGLQHGKENGPDSLMFLIVWILILSMAV